MPNPQFFLLFVGVRLKYTVLFIPKLTATCDSNCEFWGKTEKSWPSVKVPRTDNRGGDRKMSKAILSATITLAVGTLFIAGCATKNYVKQSITPVDQKIDQVDKSSQSRDSSQVADINKTNQVVDEDEKKLSATDEIAKTADGEAKGAMAKTNQNAKDLNDLRNVVANIDDYKPPARPWCTSRSTRHAHDGREVQA